MRKTLKQWRTEKGVTQKVLSQQIGLSMQALRSIENGRTIRVPPATIERICVALDLEPFDVREFTYALALLGQFPPDTDNNDKRAILLGII